MQTKLFPDGPVRIPTFYYDNVRFNSRYMETWIQVNMHMKDSRYTHEAFLINKLLALTRTRIVIRKAIRHVTAWSPKGPRLWVVELQCFKITSIQQASSID